MKFIFKVAFESKLSCVYGVLLKVFRFQKNVNRIFCESDKFSKVHLYFRDFSLLQILFTFF